MDYIKINDESTSKRNVFFGEVILAIISLFLLLSLMSAILTAQTIAPLKEHMDFDNPSGYHTRDLLSVQASLTERKQTGDVANVTFCKDDRNCFGVMVLEKNELNKEAVEDLKTNVMNYTVQISDNEYVMFHEGDQDHLWETDDSYIIGYYCTSADDYKGDYDKFIKSVELK